jgi:hypothetical protein
MNDPGTGSLRVLVLAPTGADAQIASNVLTEYGVSTRACDHISEVCECMEEAQALCCWPRKRCLMPTPHC